MSRRPCWSSSGRERAGPRADRPPVDGEDPDHLLDKRCETVELLVDIGPPDLPGAADVQRGRREGLTRAAPGLGDSEAQTGTLG